MKKMIKVEVYKGLKYFRIYEVKAIKHDREIIVYDRCLTLKDAEEQKQFINDYMSERYEVAYIMEQIVWC